MVDLNLPQDEPLVLTKDEEYGYLCAITDVYSAASDLPPDDPNQQGLIDCAVYLTNRLDGARIKRDKMTIIMFCSLVVVFIVISLPYVLAYIS